MRAVLVTAFGAASDVFKVVDDYPKPKITQPNEVLIKVAYAGVNPTDTYTRQGHTRFRGRPLPELPYAVGKDGSGIVEEVGSAVTLVKKGDRVYFLATGSGATAEYVVTRAVLPLPKGVTLAEGAAVPIPYLTAYRALFQKAHLKPGQSVLIHGASGGVGTAAVQIAKAYGAVVAGTAGTPEGLELIRKLGATTVANHRQEGYEKDLLKEFPDGFDYIIENAGHSNFERDLALIGRFGTILFIGNRAATEVNAVGLMLQEASATGVFLYYATPEDLLQAARGISKLFETVVRPVIDKVLDFSISKSSKVYEIDQLAEAHEYIIASPGAKGNHVVRVADLE